MKKLILFGLAIFSLILVYNTVNASEIVIPDSAIRIRVIANSNSIYDQTMKKKVKEYLEQNVYSLLKDTTSIEEARKIINLNLDNINKSVDNIFKDNNYNMNYKIEFGYNYFPPKEYKTVNYQEGYYESLVIYIGEANGDNWWCVLFPPLCLLDSEDLDDNEYTFFVTELINNLFS